MAQARRQLRKSRRADRYPRCPRSYRSRGRIVPGTPERRYRRRRRSPGRRPESRRRRSAGDVACVREAVVVQVTQGLGEGDLGDRVADLVGGSEGLVWRKREGVAGNADVVFHRLQGTADNDRVATRKTAGAVDGNCGRACIRIGGENGRARLSAAWRSRSGNVIGEFAPPMHVSRALTTPSKSLSAALLQSAVAVPMQTVCAAAVAW